MATVVYKTYSYTFRYRCVSDRTQDNLESVNLEQKYITMNKVTSGPPIRLFIFASLVFSDEIHYIS